jgi:PleD family two-component response regulator
VIRALRRGADDYLTKPTTRESIKSVIERMAEDPADVVLSEARLSDADAPGLAMQIRSIASDKRCYFIAWSSEVESEGWLLAPDQGMDDFVLKRNDSSANLLLSAALLRGIAP